MSSVVTWRMEDDESALRKCFQCLSSLDKSPWTGISIWLEIDCMGVGDGELLLSDIFMQQQLPYIYSCG